MKNYAKIVLDSLKLTGSRLNKIKQLRYNMFPSNENKIITDYQDNLENYTEYEYGFVKKDKTEYEVPNKDTGKFDTKIMETDNPDDMENMGGKIKKRDKKDEYSAIIYDMFSGESKFSEIYLHLLEKTVLNMLADTLKGLKTVSVAGSGTLTITEVDGNVASASSAFGDVISQAILAKIQSEQVVMKKTPSQGTDRES